MNTQGNIEEIEAREKAATPLTDKEYAEWKDNIEAIAEMEKGPWYKREGDGLVPVQDKPGGEITTTVGIQLRLFATIDALLAQLKDREEKLAAVEELRHNYETSLGIRAAPTGERGVTIRYFVNSLDHILQGGE